MMALPTRVPRALLDPFEGQRDFDAIVNRLFNRSHDGGNVAFTPYGVDIREDADHLYVDAELPGFKRDDVDISLENQTLTISAERKAATKDEAQSEWLLNERRYSRFLRSFTLPPTVDGSNVDAKLAEGVLTVTLNKREETKPRKIKVS